jgi:hypothetical protein
MDIVSTAVDRLVGLSLWACGRAGDLQWFQFGGRRLVDAYGDGTKEVGEFALHVQCSWRLRRSRGVLVGSGDRAFPATSTDGSDQEDLGLPGANRCDRLVDELFCGREDSPFVVEAATVDRDGTLRIGLAGEYVLEVFPDFAALDEEDEYWRLFRPAEDREHVVVPPFLDLL